MFRCTSPLLWRYTKNPAEITVKCRNCCESASHCNLIYRNICFPQFLTCRPDPDPVNVLNRRHPHGFLKNTAQMCFADMTYLCQLLNSKNLFIIFSNIIQRRQNQSDTGIIYNRILFLLLVPFIPSAICIRSALVSPFTSSR